MGCLDKGLITRSLSQRQFSDFLSVHSGSAINDKTDSDSARLRVNGISSTRRFSASDGKMVPSTPRAQSQFTH